MGGILGRTGGEGGDELGVAALAEPQDLGRNRWIKEGGMGESVQCSSA